MRKDNGAEAERDPEHAEGQKERDGRHDVRVQQRDVGQLKDGILLPFGQGHDADAGHRSDDGLNDRS